MTLSGIFNRDG